MAKFIYQNIKKNTEKEMPLPQKKTPTKHMKYFVIIIILVNFFLRQQLYYRSFDDLLMSSDHEYRMYMYFRVI